MMDGTGLNWTSDVYEMVLYESSKGAVDPSDTWTDFLGHIPTNGTVELTNRVLTIASGEDVLGGGCSSDAAHFADVSLVNGSFLPGYIIKRQSDDLLLCHVDQGIEGISPFASSGTFKTAQGEGDILSAGGPETKDDTQTYTFWMLPDGSQKNAWFRP